MESVLKPVIRYCAPTRYDHAPYMTIWKAQVDEPDIYIQTADLESEPQWVKIGTLLEVGFQDFISNAEFVNECVRLYRYHMDKPLHKISKMIKEIPKEL